MKGLVEFSFSFFFLDFSETMDYIGGSRKSQDHLSLVSKARAEDSRPHHFALIESEGKDWDDADTAVHKINSKAL